ncbi:hypothetical protein KP001_16300 [Geomonas subterranea]|uniref:Uncharacterized protein n=1 Tax=Geomonas subterranea TaxID=2847989 RepID=A0ABX8LGY0_9BACT|nr:hypothetical protein [Geomonas subterranea]QXE89967.1 hypothetical protein KP001_16300 [Geomonas subterranea]QXM07913.1 hypothetical protein KP002_12980 [Geomonas subterranea]
MGKVGIFEEQPQKWFQYDNDTEVLLQHVEKSRLNTILMQGAEEAKKMRAKASDVQDIFLGRAAVLNWRKIGTDDEPGFQLPDGSPFPFSTDNRNRHMVKSKRFAEFVFRVCTDELQFLEDDRSEIAGEDLKGVEEVLVELGKDEPGDGTMRGESNGERH